MKKKMVQIGKKTGLEVKEVDSLIKMGISGLLALCFSAFIGIVTIRAAEPVSPPDNKTPKSIPEKCKLVPKQYNCRAEVSTYYFDSETNRCWETFGCVSDVFDSEEACEKACAAPGGPRVRPVNKPTTPPVRPDGYPVSKYGGVGLGDF